MTAESQSSRPRRIARPALPPRLALLAAVALPALAGAQHLTVGGVVELYEPAAQPPPLGDPTASQYFGGALAVGNFDGDLYQDLAIGIPEDTGGPLLSRRAKAGTVAVVYGSAAGLDLANAWYVSQPWTGGDPGVQEVGDHFGCALAAGDFNADGVDDLAVGVCNETIGVAAEAGVVDVFYGVLGAPLGDPDQVLAEPVPAAGRHFGLALGAGDINGDGADELVVAQAAGGFYFHYGTFLGLNPTGSYLFEGGGTTIALGDFNGDSYADVVLGGPFAGWTAGDGFVYEGTALGLDLTPATWLRQDFMVNDADDGGNEADDWFGESMLAADLDGDGYDDLVIGAPGEDVGEEGSEEQDGGAVYVLRGTSSGLDLANAVYWTEWNLTSQFNPFTGDYFGTALAAGDADHDGYLELAVGCPYRNSGALEAGQVILFGGSAAGPTDFGVARAWTQDSPAVPDDTEAWDRFGRVLAFGDFDGDLQSDLAIAAPDEDDGDGHTDLGAVTVLRGCLFCDGFEAGGFGVASPVAWSTLFP